MTITADVRAILTGFGSVAVETGTVTTRGLWDDAEAINPTPYGDALIRTRRLLLAVADVPALAREDSISVGAIEDDATRTTYRVVDVQRQADGLVLEVYVAA